LKLQGQVDPCDLAFQYGTKFFSLLPPKIKRTKNMKV
jgi:hypothetical protein